MPTSYAFLCARDEASKEYDRLKHEGLLNSDLKPMPYGEHIAIPVKVGELISAFNATSESVAIVDIGDWT